jgi:hypothetical protein
VQQAAGKCTGRGERQWSVLWPWDGICVEIGDLAAAGEHVGQIGPEDLGLEAEIDDLVAGVAKLVIQVPGRESWGRTFGACIEKTREARGRSLKEAARLSGMETSEWAAVEAGYVPDPSQLHPMSDALGLGHDKLAMLAFICQGAWEA